MKLLWKLNLQRQRQKLNNKAFSLVELIVIIGIVSVMIGTVGLSIGLASRTNVKKAANAINSYLRICKEKAATNAALEWKTVITEDEVKVVKVTSDGKEQEYGSESFPSKVDIIVDGMSIPNDYDYVNIVYSQTGRVSAAYIIKDGKKVSLMEDEDSGKTKSGMRIQVKYKDKKESDVVLYYYSGKHSVE